MDQPPQQPPTISVEGILAWFLGVVATMGAIVVRGKFRVKALREKVEAEAAPQIEREYLEANEKITAQWQTEVDKLRAQIDKVREEGRGELKAAREEALDWMKRALTCESRVPALEAEIDMLKSRVKSLEELLRRSQKTDTTLGENT